MSKAGEGVEVRWLRADPYFLACLWGPADHALVPGRKCSGG